MWLGSVYKLDMMTNMSIQMKSLMIIIMIQTQNTITVTVTNL